MPKIRVIVFGENVHEKKHPNVAKIYPKGMHEAIADGLRPDKEMEVRTVTLDQPEHGLTEKVLAETDVLVWWGHAAHGDVQDKVVDLMQKRVLEGMGLVVLHSGHYSKIFKRLMGTTCSLNWREAGEKERVWVCDPRHPIAQGIDRYFEIPHEEMYGEPFGIPEADETIFISWFQGGEVFRSGCTWKRGHGKIFYFRPGHESYPTYHQKEVLHVIRNGARWAKSEGVWKDDCPNVPYDKAPEKITPQGEGLHKPGEAGLR
jgi:trehalose utilization protein